MLIDSGIWHRLANSGGRQAHVALWPTKESLCNKYLFISLLFVVCLHVCRKVMQWSSPSPSQKIFINNANKFTWTALEQSKRFFLAFFLCLLKEPKVPLVVTLSVCLGKTQPKMPAINKVTMTTRTEISVVYVVVLE